MTNLLILGANGQIARHVVQALASEKMTLHVTLLAREPPKLGDKDLARMKVIEGSVSDSTVLHAAMNGQNIVYANLSGAMDVLASDIILAMKAASVQRLIFVAALGIYDEIPGKFGEWNRHAIGESLGPYRRAADLIESSGLDYTILRPAWLTDVDEVDYETTDRHEDFKGTEVSRRSVASFILKVLRDPLLASRANIGMNKPGTDADMPGPLTEAADHER